MNLTVLERLLLIDLLPKEGNHTNLKLIRVGKETLSFNDIENEKLNFVQNSDQVVWDPIAAIDIDAHTDIKLGEVVTGMIVKRLKSLDGEEKLKEEHFSLYEKFIT